jgi:sugar lactone lactonase YvrE
MAKVEDLWLTPGPKPNGIHAAPDGLWVIDQENNHLYKLSWHDGSALIDVPTDTYSAGGVTVANGYVWVSSTHSHRVYKLNEDGTTVAYFDPPGKGIVDARDPTPDLVRPVGMEWVDGKIWVGSRPAWRIFQCEPDTMQVLHSIPAPGVHQHGIAWDNGALWCSDREQGIIRKLDPKDGEVLDEIHVPDPEVHGLTMHDGDLMFCCAETRRVCRVIR